MAYRLDPRVPVEDEVRRIAAELLDDAAARLRLAPHHQASDIHATRKDLKKLRSLLRLVSLSGGDRGSRAAEVARDAGRRLSGQRDRAVATHTFESLVPDLAGVVGQTTLLRVRAGLVSAASAPSSSSGGLRSSGPPVEHAVADDLDALLLATGCWSVEGRGFAALEAGLRRRYAQGREQLGALGRRPDAEQLHELRKRVKDHWYHLRLLRDVWPPVLDALADEAGTLADQLGDDHDLAVLADLLQAGDPDLLGRDRTVVLAAIEDRRAALLVAIRAGATRAYADKPGAFTRRLRTSWHVAAR